MLKPAVFLDRDGTILNERGYLADPQDIEFYPGAFRALRRLRRAGFHLVIVSNQSGVGRGYFTLSQLGRVHARFRQILKRHGAPIDGIFICPHKPNAGCPCRKPKPTMALRAARQLGLDLKRSFVIGDQARDIQMAKNLGVPGVLVLTGAGRSARAEASKIAAKISPNVDHASRWVVEAGRRGGKVG